MVSGISKSRNNYKNCVWGGGQKELFGVLNVCFKGDGGRSGSMFRLLLRMI